MVLLHQKIPDSSLPGLRSLVLLTTQLNAGSNIRSYRPLSMGVDPYLCSHCPFWIPPLIPLVWKFLLLSVLPISFPYSRSINIHVPCSPWKPSLQILCPKAYLANTCSRQPTNGLSYHWSGRPGLFYSFFVLRGLNSAPKIRGKKRLARQWDIFLVERKDFFTCISQHWWTSEKWTETPNSGMETPHSVSPHNLIRSQWC